MAGLNPRLHTGFEESPESLVPERLDHLGDYSALRITQQVASCLTF